MNNKGLTLIELLATLLVLAIVATIVFTNVTGIIKEKREKTNEYQENIIKEATESYVADSINDGNDVCEEYISVSTLIQDGYLDEEYKKYNYSVKVTCKTKGTNQIYSYDIEK
mgnify:CR=1 FL=1